MPSSTPQGAANAVLSTPSSGAPARPAARGVLVALSLGMLLPSLSASIANVALPSLAQAFAAPFASVQWVVIAYLLTITALVVSAGRLGDLIGRRRLLLVGLAVFALGSALGGAATGLWGLVAARVVQGVGAAIMMALTLALVSEVVPQGRAGSAMGLLGTVSAVGTALGPALGGLLIGAWGWPAVFWLNVPLGLVALAMLWRHLPDDRPAGPSPARPRAPRFDLIGTALLSFTLTSYALATTLGQGRWGALNAGLLFVAVVGGTTFVWAQRRAVAPLVRLALLREPVLAAGFATSALVTAVVMATLVVGPFYLAGALGLDALRLGLVMSVGPAVAALVGAPAGRLVDRRGAPRVGAAGLVLMFAGSVALPFSSAAWGVAGYAAALALITAGYAAFQASNNTAVMAHAGADQRGVVSGLLNLSRNLGLITGASVMGAVFQAGASMQPLAAASPLALTAGLRLSFWVAAGFVATAGLVTLLARTANRRQADAH
jgi:MFS family permease